MRLLLFAMLAAASSAKATQVEQRAPIKATVGEQRAQINTTLGEQPFKTECSIIAPELWKAIGLSAGALKSDLASAERSKRIRISSSERQQINRLYGMLREYEQRGSLDKDDLSALIDEIEKMQETVRNKRQMAATAFQNFDQKANQMYNLLSSIMKAMNEMRIGTVRNML